MVEDTPLKNNDKHKTGKLFIKLWANIGPYIFAAFISQVAGSNVANDYIQGQPLTLRATLLLFLAIFIIHMTIMAFVLYEIRTTEEFLAKKEKQSHFR